MVLDILPEILAQATFFPMGLALSFIMFSSLWRNQISSSEPNVFLEDLTFAPYIIVACTAMISCSVMLTIKHHYNKFKFEHFYLLALGMIAICAGGGLLLLIEKDTDHRLGMYVMSAGIGLAYVPGIMYIYLRSSKYRTLKMSIAHVFYLLGFAVGITILVDPLQLFQNTVSSYARLADVLSYFIMGFSGLLLIGYVSNEILQFVADDYDYKTSLDYDLERENNFGGIFKKHYFPIVANRRRIEKQSFKSIQWAQNNQFLAILVVLLGKITSIIYFYYPFLRLNILALSILGDEHIFISLYFGVAGILISSILLLFKSPKFGFIQSCSYKIAVIIVLTVVINVEISSNAVKYVFWLFYLGLGFGYSHPDINILELTSFIANELILTLGLIFEMLIIGAMHYFTTYDTSTILRGARFVDKILPHSIAFAVACFILCVVAIFMLPITNNKSVLEIKNMMTSSTSGSSYSSQESRIPPQSTAQRSASRPPSTTQRSASRPPSRQPTRQASPVLDFQRAPASIYSVPNPNSSIPYPEHLRGMETTSNYDYETVEQVNILPRARIDGSYNTNYEITK